jgi:UDP-N-acetylmuramate--alanine ligase
VGIGGIGMSGLAQMLRRRGYEVAGSDRQLTGPGRDGLFASLRSLGIGIHPQDGSGIAATKPDVLIASAAVEEGNPDFLAAEGIPRLGRAEALSAALQTSGTRLLAVAGSCGKTSVTGWLAAALRALGHRVEMVCGGYALNCIGPGAPGNYSLDPDPEFSVVEVDESDKSLVQFRPELGLLLNVGRDHYEHEELVGVFGTFLDHCSGSVVLAADLADTFSAHGPALRTLFGSAGEHGDVILDSYVPSPDGIRFALSDMGPCTSGQMGRHSALNAAAVAAVLLQLGIDRTEIPAALASFRGIAQRFQRMGGSPHRHIPMYLDYAHNPEKIGAAIRAAQEAADGPILAAFQPHGYGPLGFMRNELRNVLARTLRPSDLLVILPVYYVGGTTSFRPTSAEVAVDYASSGLPVCTVHPREALIDKADEFAAAARLALVMGARDPSLPEWAAALADAL